VLRDFLMESFDRFQLAGLTLICLKNKTRAGAGELAIQSHAGWGF